LNLCSLLNAQRSMLNAQCSTLNAQRSVLNAQCCLFAKIPKNVRMEML